MTRKGTVLFWTDALNGLLFLSLMLTGSIMRWVLPPGSGGGGAHGGVGRGFRGGGGGGGRGAVQTLWTLDRHDWGDVHFWIAVALVACILLHLALHWGWLKAGTWRCVLAPLIAGRRLTTAGTCG